MAKIRFLNYIIAKKMYKRTIDVRRLSFHTTINELNIIGTNNGTKLLMSKNGQEISQYFAIINTYEYQSFSSFFFFKLSLS